MSVADDFYSIWDQQKAPQAVANGATITVNVPAGGHPYAIKALEDEAVEVANAREGTRNDTLNTAAFRMGRHVGAGTIDAQLVRSTLADAARMAGLPQHEIDTVLRDDANAGINQGALSPRTPSELETPPVTVLDLEPETEDAFWSARPVLTHLHTFAKARMVSPWAVLGITLARVITATPHQVCLPPIIGGKASLNMFVGIVGKSGAGKGGAESVAADALDVGFIETHNVGSGEGIAHGYKRRVKGNLEWLDEDHAVLFSVPEIDSLAAQGDRKGATLMPQLRSGWTGEQLGFGYADPTKRIIVEAHQYRLCLVAGIQPARAGCLLDDADGGTPQRFLWLPALDFDAPDMEPSEPKQMRWRAPSVSSLVAIGGVKIDVCEVARVTIKENRRATLRGQTDALDGHALLAQLKTAAALGVIDGRYSVTDEDWALAGVIAQKSAATRAGVVRTLSMKVAQANAARADAEASRAVRVAEHLDDTKVKKVCNTILRRLRRDEEWVAQSEVKKAVAGRDRGHYEDALDRLVQAGQIELENNHYRAVGGQK